MASLTASPAWHALLEHRQRFSSSTADLFAADVDRFKRFSVAACGLVLDYSKQAIDAQTIRLLVSLAQQQQLDVWRQKMFAADAINHTEQRAVLHGALRDLSRRPCFVDGQDVMPCITDVLRRIEDFVTAIHTGQWRGYTALPIRDVINLGIGGSDLGAAMVTEALRAFRHPRVRVRFVSNVDGSHLRRVLTDLDPATTLFIITSKTFTTQETMANAASARHWLLGHGLTQVDLARHVIAVTANIKEANNFGIDPDHIFPFWKWIGGRFSLWSAVGLPIALATNMQTFQDLLAGAYAMDQHFQTAPYDVNLPVLMALIGLWNINFSHINALAILPYDQNLEGFVPYLQQLDMESNGKSVDRDGRLVDYHTAPIVFGKAGTNGQHTFYQLLYQGTSRVACDFLIAAHTFDSLTSHQGEHHTMLFAHFLAHSQGLMDGYDDSSSKEAAVDKHTATLHKCFSYSRPISTVLYDRLDPRTLGTLIALYEHKIFVQGIMWNINSFDQWGVELGKQRVLPILADLTNSPSNVDQSKTSLLHARSTHGLIDWWKKHR